MVVSLRKRNLGRGEDKNPIPEGWGLLPGRRPKRLQGLGLGVSAAKKKRGGEGAGGRP